LETKVFYNKSKVVNKLSDFESILLDIENAIKKVQTLENIHKIK
jgi:hypothetical protein